MLRLVLCCCLSHRGLGGDHDEMSGELGGHRETGGVARWTGALVRRWSVRLECSSFISNMTQIMLRKEVSISINIPYRHNHASCIRLGHCRLRILHRRTHYLGRNFGVDYHRRNMSRHEGPNLCGGDLMTFWTYMIEMMSSSLEPDGETYTSGVKLLGCSVLDVMMFLSRQVWTIESQGFYQIIRCGSTISLKDLGVKRMEIEQNVV